MNIETNTPPPATGTLQVAEAPAFNKEKAEAKLAQFDVARLAVRDNQSNSSIAWLPFLNAAYGASKSQVFKTLGYKSAAKMIAAKYHGDELTTSGFREGVKLMNGFIKQVQEMPSNGNNRNEAESFIFDNVSKIMDAVGSNSERFKETSRVHSIGASVEEFEANVVKIKQISDTSKNKKEFKEKLRASFSVCNPRRVKKNTAISIKAVVEPYQDAVILQVIEDICTELGVNSGTGSRPKPKTIGSVFYHLAQQQSASGKSPAVTRTEIQCVATDPENALAHTERPTGFGTNGVTGS